ncbi:MAG: hypothetical protein GX558_09095, partial [Clostridiales bacterium]|nr:hypothetical protein [Clostridiales bacterium]
MRRVSFRANSILVRLMVLFLLMILPIFGVGLSLFSWGVSLQDQQIERILGQQLQAKLRQLEVRMQAVQTAILYLSSDPDTRTIAGMPYSMSDYERARKLNGLQRQLWTLAVGDEIINHISLYLPMAGKRVVSNAYAANVSTIDDIDRAEFERLVELGAREANVTAVSDNSISYLLQSPYSHLLPAGQRPRVLFRVSYDVPAIKALLSGVLEGQQFAMLADDGRLWISAESDPAMRQAVSAYAAGDTGSSPALTPEDGVRVIRLNGVNCYAMVEESRIPNARILFYVSRDGALSSLVDYRAWVWALT